MRKLFCEECGKPRPLHPEDEALGLIPRRKSGKLRNAALCDACGKEMPATTVAMAESIPNNMGAWERDYLEIEP